MNTEEAQRLNERYPPTRGEAIFLNALAASLWLVKTGAKLGVLYLVIRAAVH